MASKSARSPVTETAHLNARPTIRRCWLVESDSRGWDHHERIVGHRCGQRSMLPSREFTVPKGVQQYWRDLCSATPRRINMAPFDTTAWQQPSTLAVGALGLVVLYKVVRTLYTAFLSPLAKIPGPTACALTSFVDSYQSTVGGRRSEWIHSLHQTYGRCNICGNPNCPKRRAIAESRL